jgi:peptidoglycan/LPS O-acetylase OafA/YrhL
MTEYIKRPGKEAWIKGLDSIRFILAMIVFLSHLDNPFHAILVRSPHFILRAAGMVWGLLFSGVGAVMAFFIISGFVIHYPNKERMPETVPFLVRRWLRIILPLLVIGVIASARQWFDSIPVWSLYCELIYYTIYPVLIRIRLSWFNKVIISFIIALSMIVFCARNDWSSLIHQRNIHYSGAYWQLGPYLTWMIGLPCWLLGVLLAEGIDASPRVVSRSNIYGFRVTVLICGILLDVLKFHFFFGYFFSMNLFSILLFFWIRQEILYYKDRQPVHWLEFSGKFSYSLYLCHSVFVHYILLVVPLNVYTYFPIVFVVPAAAYLYYLIVEKPSHLLSRNAGKLLKAKSIASI